MTRWNRPFAVLRGLAVVGIEYGYIAAHRSGLALGVSGLVRAIRAASARRHRAVACPSTPTTPEFRTGSVTGFSGMIISGGSKSLIIDEGRPANGVRIAVSVLTETRGSVSSWQQHAVSVCGPSLPPTCDPRSSPPTMPPSTMISGFSRPRSDDHQDGGGRRGVAEGQVAPRTSRSGRHV